MKIERDLTSGKLPNLTPPGPFEDIQGPSAGNKLEYQTIGYQEFAPEVATVAEVRRFVRQVLDGQGFDRQSVTTCELIADELATNAVTYAGTFYSVVVELSDVSVRIAVRDNSRELPALQERIVDAESGRGLSVVSETSTNLGC